MADDDPDHPSEATGPPQPHAFVILGNEIRVELVKLIGDASIHEGEDPSFSELRSQIDMSLDPGQLNYHLKKLRGHFVEKTDEGYDLRTEGIHLYKTLRTGGFDRPEEEFTMAARIDCHYCQAPVEARFLHGAALVECTDCGYRYLGYPIDDIAPIPALVEDEPSAFDQLSKYLHHEILGYARGICRTCGLELGAELLDPDEAPGSKSEWKKVYVHRWCDHCGSSLYLFLGVALLANTHLLLFCYDHDVDVLSTPFWRLDFAATDHHVTVHSKDPWEVSLQVSFGGDTLELVVDGAFEVIERQYQYSAREIAQSRSSRAPSEESMEQPGGGPDEKSSERPNGLTGDRAGANSPVGGLVDGDDADLPENGECLQYLRRQRWPERVRCPHCGSADTIKKGRTGKDAKRYRCRNCTSTFNDLTDTIFADRNLDLPEMFYIIGTLDETNTAEKARHIDRSYQAVLDFVNEVRAARDDGFDNGIAE